MVEARGRMTAVHVSQPSNPTLTHRGNTVEKHVGLDHGSCAFTWQKMFVHLLWFAMAEATKSDSQGFLRFSYVTHLFSRFHEFGAKLFSLPLAPYDELLPVGSPMRALASESES